jgi:hypothetical protein
MNRNGQLSGKNFQVFKGWSIDPAFDKAKKIDRDIEQFRELLLAHFSGQPNRLKAIAEFFAKGRQVFHLWAECRSCSRFSPPNEITGSGFVRQSRRYFRGYFKAVELLGKTESSLRVCSAKLFKIKRLCVQRYVQDRSWLRCPLKRSPEPRI